MSSFKLKGIVKGQEDIEINNNGDEVRKVVFLLEPQTGGTKTRDPIILDKAFAEEHFPVGQHVEITVLAVDGPAAPLPNEELPLAPGVNAPPVTA